MTKEEIISVLADLHNITGFRVSLHAADYSEIAAYPVSKCELCRIVHSLPGEYERCVASDKQACKAALDKKDTHIYKCRYGMTEAISPLYNFGTLTGFLMMGQIYESEEDRHKRCDELLRLPILHDKVEAIIDAIPTVNKAMIASYVKIMTICAQYLTLSHAIPSNKPTIAQLAKEYISVNFAHKISIKKICTEVGCSKSSLITAFKREAGITVNAYITEVRLSEALRLLEMGDSKIGEIAEACGFSDQSYFSKVFSAKYGVPPSEYDKISEIKKPIWR